MTPPALDRAVRRCLAKNPDDRWQTARDLKDELKWIAEGGTAGIQTAPGPAPSRWRYAGWVVAALGVTAALLAVLVNLRGPVLEPQLLRLQLDTGPESDPVSFALSPDGRVILFSRTADKTGNDIWSLSVAGASMPTPVLQTPFDEDEAQFSPDGQWIAYRSNESGRPEVYVRPFPGPGNAIRVSTMGGEEPRWRRDGQELFFISVDRKLMAASVALRSPERAIQMNPVIPLFPTRLTMVGLQRQQYAVDADGRRFWMNVKVDEPNSFLTIVQNWDQELKRLVPTR